MPGEGGGGGRNSPDLEEMRIVLRSILTTFKQGCPVNTLLQEYYESCGSTLPFRALGYHSATELLTDLPEVARFSQDKEGQVVVFAVSTQHTRHVADLVRRQKTSSSKSKKRSLTLPRSYPNNRRPPMRQSTFGRNPYQIRSSSQDNRNYPSAESFRKSTQSSNGSFQKPRAPAPVPPRFQRTAEVTRRTSNQVEQASAKQNFNGNDSTVKRQLELLAHECSLDIPVYKSVSICKGKAFMCSVKVGPHSAGSIVEFPTANEAETAAAKNAMKLLSKYYQTNEQNSTDNGSNRADNGSSTSSIDEETGNFEVLCENLLLLLKNHPNGIVNQSLAKEYSEHYGKNLPADWIRQLEDNAPEISLTKIDDYRVIVAKNIVRSPSILPRNQLLLAPISPTSTKFVADVDEEVRPAPIFTNIVGMDDRNLHKTGPVSVDDDVFSSPKLDAIEGQDQRRRSVVINEARNSILEFHRPDDERRQMFDDPPPVHPRAPEPLPFPESAYWNVHVHTVESPAQFIFRLNEFDNVFYQLRFDMDEFYKNNESDPIENESDFKKDRHLYACEADDSWHRVSLVEILADCRQAIVDFIDYGDRNTVNFDQMRQLEPEFVGFPAQAVNCCLKGFENWHYDDFDPPVVETFRKLVFDKDLMVQRCHRPIQEKKTDDQDVDADDDKQDVISVIVVVNVIDDETGSEETFFVNEIIEKMVPDDKFQELNSFYSSSDDGEGDGDEHPAVNLHNSTITIDPENDDNAKSAAFFSPDNNHNQSEIVELTNGAHTAEDLSQLSLSDKKLPGAASEKNGTDIVYEDSELPPFKDFGDEFDVLVVFAADPTEFSIQPIQQVSKLESLMKDLKDFYSAVANLDDPRLKIDPKSGEFYAALVNDVWFRVFCCDNKCSNAVSIFLVDYGEFYVCPSTNLRRLSIEFRRLPMVTVQCSLADVRPFDKRSHSYDGVCSMRFGEKVTNNIYRASVKSFSIKKSFNKPMLPHLEIDLIDNGDGRSISDWLIECKYAAKV